MHMLPPLLLACYVFEYHPGRGHLRLVCRSWNAAVVLHRRREALLEREAGRRPPTADQVDHLCSRLQSGNRLLWSGRLEDDLRSRLANVRLAEDQDWTRVEERVMESFSRSILAPKTNIGTLDTTPSGPSAATVVCAHGSSSG